MWLLFFYLEVCIISSSPSSTPPFSSFFPKLNFLIICTGTKNLLYFKGWELSLPLTHFSTCIFLIVASALFHSCLFFYLTYLVCSFILYPEIFLHILMMCLYPDLSFIKLHNFYLNLFSNFIHILLYFYLHLIYLLVLSSCLLFLIY